MTSDQLEIELRKLGHVTQRAMARALGISPGHLNKVLNDREPISRRIERTVQALKAVNDRPV